MADVTAPPAAEEKGVKGFKLLDNTEGHVTIYRVGKQTKFLNHGKQPIEYPQGSKQLVQPATQEQIKELYDAHPSYVAFVQAPAGYNDAPWQKTK
jgi:hypothetical protein